MTRDGLRLLNHVTTSLEYWKKAVVEDCRCALSTRAIRLPVVAVATTVRVGRSILLAVTIRIGRDDRYALEIV